MTKHQSTINNQQSSIQKILVMDDEEMVRDVTTAMLRYMGYEVELAVDGAEAIKMYRDAMESGKTYDAVILDLTNKFGMGGIEAVKRLLEIDPEIRAIVATGYCTDSILTDFREYGFRAAMAKPFMMKELAEAMGKALD